MFLAGTKERNVVSLFLPIISSAGYVIQLPKKSDRLHKISLKLISNVSVLQMTVDTIAVPHPGTITLCIHEIKAKCHSHESKTLRNMNAFLSFYLLCTPLFPVLILICLMDLVNVNLIYVTEEKK